MTDKQEYSFFTTPKYTWELRISSSFGICIRYTDESVPNIFHRLMQKLILGFEWKKL